MSWHATTRRRLPHWKKDGAIYWITLCAAKNSIGSINVAKAFLLCAFRKTDIEKGRQECLPHLHTRFLNGSISHSAGMALIDSRKKQPTVTIHESIRPVGGCIRIQ